MKIPDGVDIKDLPGEIQYLLCASIANMPVGSSSVDKAMELYPEYFLEEVEYCRKRALIPKPIDDAYYTEYTALNDWWYSELPTTGKGLYYYATHPEEYNNWHEECEQLHKKYDKEEMERRIWNKYYTLWGLRKEPPTAEQILEKQQKQEAKELKAQRDQQILDNLWDMLENL